MPDSKVSADRLWRRTVAGAGLGLYAEEARLIGYDRSQTGYQKGLYESFALRNAKFRNKSFKTAQFRTQSFETAKLRNISTNYLRKRAISEMVVCMDGIGCFTHGIGCYLHGIGCFKNSNFVRTHENHSKVSMAGSKSRFCLGFEARFLVSQNNTLSMLEITV